MRKLVVLAAAALLAVPSLANAAVLDHADSWLVLKIAGLQRQDVQGVYDGAIKGCQACLTGAAGAQSIQMNNPNNTTTAAGAALFGTVNNELGAALFTGVNQISNLFLTVENGSGSFDKGFSGSWQQGALGASFGGVAGLSGTNTIEILGGASLIPVPLGVVGAGGQATAMLASTATVFVDGAPWVTSKVFITGILTNVIAITNGTRMGQTGAPFTLSATINESTAVMTENGIATVCIEGTKTISGTAPGMVTLVTPIYVDASDATQRAPIPAAGFMKLTYVPEPGTMLLLGSAVAGLLVVGRKRMQR